MNNAKRDVNKYGVPHHHYSITLADGLTACVDVGCEEDWGDIQGMGSANDTYSGCKTGEVPGDFAKRVGFGNEESGRTEIVAVVDETGESLDPFKWATEKVWIYAANYSA